MAAGSSQFLRDIAATVACNNIYRPKSRSTTYRFGLREPRIHSPWNPNSYEIVIILSLRSLTRLGFISKRNSVWRSFAIRWKSMSRIKRWLVYGNESKWYHVCTNSKASRMNTRSKSKIRRFNSILLNMCLFENLLSNRTSLGSTTNLYCVARTWSPS